MDVHVQQGSLLLVPDNPLVILPPLAVEIGLNEAIVVQQLHYWTKRSEDPEGWVYNTMAEWLEQFPFWSESTIKRTWRSLREQKLVEIAQRGGTDRTNHYRLVYDALPRYQFRSGQSDPMNGSKRSDAADQDDPVTNNNPETSTENPPNPPGGAPRKKVNRKPVTDAEYELAASVIAAFNEIADTRYQVDAHLTPVVGRIRERPDLTAEQHRAVITAAFADPHWKGHPAPAVVYGNAALFEASVERARKGKDGGKRDPLEIIAARDA